MLACSVANPCVAAADSIFELNLASSDLSDALQSLSAQASLQIVYEQALISGKRSAAVRGKLPLGAALRRLLRGTGLDWRFVDDATVAIYRPERDAARESPDRAAAATRTSASGEVVDIGDIDVRADRMAALNGNSNAAFGFSKSLIETPRSVTLINEEAIETFNLSAVEDLAGLAPGVFTTTRFGIQGSVDVRNVPADTYFRGMKRLTLQGHGRSVLAALDSIEIVGGPPSPLYGMGKIGGYTNVVPKSGRAQSGKYMSETQGYLQLIGGGYDRREVSLGVGGPLSFLKDSDRQGGYYVYGLVEDSGSYTQGVPIRQRLLQAASNVDDVAGSFRLESGVNYQESRTSGALINRLTQGLVDSGEYISGTPLLNLDTDGSGSIDLGEMYRASPVNGRASPGNQPLGQYFPWPKGPDGTPLPSLAAFPKVAGIPRQMYDYLVAHPEADPTGALRAAGPGGPVPTSGVVPLGLALDPASVHYSTLDPRHSAAFERESNAKFLTAYADLVRDHDPDFTIKNQLFFDSMDQYKVSDQPLLQIQKVNVVEDKLTITRRLHRLPAWLKADSLFSVNLRNTQSTGLTTSGLSDYSNHRTDAMAPTFDLTPGGMTPNTTFDVGTFPWTSIYRTDFSEMGVGGVFDIELASGTNVVLGGRYDGSHARNTDFAGRFDMSSGSGSAPGSVIQSDDSVAAWDSGASWTVSVSQAMPHSLHPYVTLARSSIMLDGNNNSLTNAIIRAGHVGSARLKEVGLKAALLQDRLFFTTSLYEQARAEVDGSDSPALLNAYATATTTRGWQTEMRWSPVKGALVSFYALNQTTTYTPNIGGAVQVDAAALGFQDILDAAGNIVFPANAFLYGGRVRIMLPDNLPAYRKKRGNPETQVGLSAVYQLANGLGFTFKSNYLSSTCSGRLCLVVLPSSLVYDAGIFHETHNWSLRLTVFNLTDEHYFRARTGDVLGDVVAQAMPGRRWQATLKYKF